MAIYLYKTKPIGQKKSLILTKKIGQPLRLVVVLDGDGAGVEEDKDDNKPEPPLLLTHSPHPELELLQGQHDS